MKRANFKLALNSALLLLWLYFTIHYILVNNAFWAVAATLLFTFEWRDIRLNLKERR